MPPIFSFLPEVVVAAPHLNKRPMVLQIQEVGGKTFMNLKASCKIRRLLDSEDPSTVIMEIKKQRDSKMKEPVEAKMKTEKGASIQRWRKGKFSIATS